MVHMYRVVIHNFSMKRYSIRSEIVHLYARNMEKKLEREALS